MVRPTRITVNNGDNSWESQLNTNFQQLYDRPLPIVLHAGTLANLETIRPAAQFQWCLAIVDYDSAGTPGQHVAFSNGTAWKLASNWEFLNRKVVTLISAVHTILDTDGIIVLTGSGTFDLTLPAIADNNEGREINIKQTGTGTVTLKTTGADTIDGAATVVLSAENVSICVMSDGTSDWIVVGSSGGAETFIELSDTPATFTGQALKGMRVNTGETAVEFVDLVNVVGTQLKHNARARTSGTETVVALPGAVMDLPTEISSFGTAITWNATNKEFEINEDGFYLVLSHGQTTSASAHNPASSVQLDTGGGYAQILGAVSFNSNGIRQSMGTMLVHSFSAGDTVQLWIGSSGTVSSREGTHMSIIKLDGSIAGGGNMEVFQQGLELAETSAFAATMTVVDLQSPIINNAVDIYTFTAGTDVVTINQAGLYMISYTIVADETSGTLETAAKLQKDIGAGFVDIEGSESSGSGADKFTHGNTVLVELAATDEIKLMAQYTTAGGNAVAGTMLRIVRLKRGSDSIDYAEDLSVDTGRKWIDGKAILRKVITTAGAIATGVTTHAHSITTIDRIITLTGFLERDDGAGSHVPINYTQVGAEVASLVDDTNVTLVLNAVYTGAGNILSNPQFVIEYTV